MPRASNNVYSSYSPELCDVVTKVLHRIGDIDHQHEAEIHKVDIASSDKELKHYIKQKIRAAHQKRRQPYIDLLSSLRLTQQR